LNAILFKRNSDVYSVKHKKMEYKKNRLSSRLILMISCLVTGCLPFTSEAQNPYKAPQDTVKARSNPNEPLTTITKSQRNLITDSRLKGMALTAAEMLKDTVSYNRANGIALTQLFTREDLEYLAQKGINNAIVVFELINDNLPKGRFIAFRTDQTQTLTTGENPLELKNLRALIAAKPATINGNKLQWQENVYQAYLARDYGTKLENTITITSATRELRESPELTLVDFDGKEINLKTLSLRHQGNHNNSLTAEKAAVADFRAHTFPGDEITKENANENYKRSLYKLMDLQEGDINRHPKSQQALADLANDLKKGNKSLFLTSLKNSTFFDSNVPGNLGPVILTESEVVNANAIISNAAAKAMELYMLVALHYGERDAIKLITQVLGNGGAVAANKTNIFSPKRLQELAYHGTEKYKSLGFGVSKTKDMTIADLVLVAVASPVTPQQEEINSFLTLQQVGQSVINQYFVETDTRETKNSILFNPRIKIGSRHTEYRAANDAVDFVPDYVNHLPIGQKGSRVVQNGVELRLESDLYFSNPDKIIATGVKPAIFPEFGIIIGAGKRSVGYDNSTLPGKFGAVPQFKNNLSTWGAHLGINVGPVLLSEDATIMSTKNNDDPYRRFFDLSSGMTYYRYSLLTHVINWGFGDVEHNKGAFFTVDAEFTGETNNEWYHDITNTQNTAMQINSQEWRRDYGRAHPNGVFNQQIATEMIIDGDAKAAYASTNTAALNIGIIKSDFHLVGTVGLYNLFAMPNDNSLGKIVSNTAKGNVFGAIGLTYNFGSLNSLKSSRKKESYQINNGIESPHTVEQSSTNTSSNTVPRDHAIFTNKKSKRVAAEKKQ
jgi:hypothetical protein